MVPYFLVGHGGQVDPNQSLLALLVPKRNLKEMGLLRFV